MAERHTKTPMIDDAVGNGPVSEMPEPQATPTLDDAFTVLRKALMAHYQDRDMNNYLRCGELGAIHANGNVGFSWQQIIFILEQALGVNLRVS